MSTRLTTKADRCSTTHRKASKRRGSRACTRYLTIGNPIKLSESAADVIRSPLLGEHTDEILRDVLGMGDDDIADAREQGAI